MGSSGAGNTEASEDGGPWEELFGAANAADIPLSGANTERGVVLTGTMKNSNGSFGFIRQDVGGDDMFVMPAACQAFGSVLPAMNTRLRYEVVTDAKTGKLRAENVVPEASMSGDGASPSSSAAGSSCGGCPGYGAYGGGGGWGGGGGVWGGCQGAGPGCGGGAYVSSWGGGCGGYGPSGGFGPGSSMGGMPRGKGSMGPGFGGAMSGTMLKANGNFGFIKQDTGEEDMFVMPAACVAWGGQLPGIGERVLYEIVCDQKTGRPRADNVRPAMGCHGGAMDFGGGGYSEGWGKGGGCRGHPYGGYGACGKMGGKGAFPGKGAEAFPALPRGGSQQLTGSIEKVNGNFGFIKQDSGDADMFVMPAACSEFGGQLPPVGTRVCYRVVTDSKTLRPRAEDVGPIMG